MNAPADWPYDALRDDPLTALRIPVVPGSHPHWCYIVAFDGSSPARPTDTEALMLQSFLREYIEHWYTETWKLKLAARAFDLDGSANGVAFHKWAEGDWGYRRSTWTTGPLYWPGGPWMENRTAHALPKLLDRVHTIVDEVSPRWLEWKAAHPEVFGG